MLSVLAVGPYAYSKIRYQDCVIVTDLRNIAWATRK